MPPRAARLTPPAAAPTPGNLARATSVRPAIARATRQRFVRLWERAVGGAPSTTADLVHADLNWRLTGPDRRFHDLGHIDECLRQCDRVATIVPDRDALELGLWFHDADYVPGDPDNEKRSAELFLRFSAGAPAGLRRRVAGLILATRHRTPARSLERCYIEDIDLVGFGASFDHFMAEGDLLRDEFAVQSDDTYYRSQVAFLRSLQKRPSFFLTDYFRSRYEDNARRNIAALLELRSAQGYAACGV
ncbi:MAG: hypothetical protein U1F10_02310 [Burkholderiales bacterium]